MNIYKKKPKRFIFLALLFNQDSVPSKSSTEKLLKQATSRTYISLEKISEDTDNTDSINDYNQYIIDRRSENLEIQENDEFSTPVNNVKFASSSKNIKNNNSADYENRNQSNIQDSSLSSSENKDQFFFDCKSRNVEDWNTEVNNLSENKLKYVNSQLENYNNLSTYHLSNVDVKNIVKVKSAEGGLKRLFKSNSKRKRKTKKNDIDILYVDPLIDQFSKKLHNSDTKTQNEILISPSLNEKSFLTKISLNKQSNISNLHDSVYENDYILNPDISRSNETSITDSGTLFLNQSNNNSYNQSPMILTLDNLENKDNYFDLDTSISDDVFYSNSEDDSRTYLDCSETGLSKNYSGYNFPNSESAISIANYVNLITQLLHTLESFATEDDDTFIKAAFFGFESKHMRVIKSWQQSGLIATERLLTCFSYHFINKLSSNKYSDNPNILTILSSAKENFENIGM